MLKQKSSCLPYLVIDIPLEDESHPNQLTHKVLQQTISHLLHANIASMQYFSSIVAWRSKKFHQVSIFVELSRRGSDWLKVVLMSNNGKPSNQHVRQIFFQCSQNKLKLQNRFSSCQQKGIQKVNVSLTQYLQSAFLIDLVCFIKKFLLFARFWFRFSWEMINLFKKSKSCFSPQKV